MTIITNIGNFDSWFSVMKEMENQGIEKIKIEDVLCFGNSTRLRGIGWITLEEVKQNAKNEHRKEG